MNSIFNPFFLIGLLFLFWGVFNFKKYLKGWGLYWLNYTWYWKRYIKPSKATSWDKTWLLIDALIFAFAGIMIILKSKSGL